MDETQRLWLRLHLTPGLGRTGLMRLQRAFGSPQEVFSASKQALTDRAGIRAGVARSLVPETDPGYWQTLERLLKEDVRLLTLWDEDYPALLRQIHDPPALLYVRGTLPMGDCLAVVGSRRTSEGVLKFTERLCTELSAAGVVIVSGLARGIDSAAHRGALSGGGLTIGVLGCGIDRVYPPENDRLFQQVSEKGALLSEYPPGTPPLPGHFPGRNRIISGLSQGVLVVEAAEGSGSLITADFALDQGREVFAVPGSVGNRNSTGTNRLLKDGAVLVTEASDILDTYRPGVERETPLKDESPLSESLSETERKLYLLLEQDPLHIDEIIRRSGLTPMEVSDILLHLELQGGVRSLPGSRYLRS